MSVTPRLLLLGAMVAWGTVMYPKVPDPVPGHVGPGGVGAAFLPLCWMQWRTTRTAAQVPARVTPAALALVLVPLAPVGVAWWRDRVEKKALTC